LENTIPMDKDIIAIVGMGKGGKAILETILQIPGIYVKAVYDINPQAPVHVLFIPKIRINTINDIKDNQSQLIGELYLAVRDYAKQIGEDENGYRVTMNCNDNGQQTVHHIHLHFLAGRQMQWPPG